MDLSNIFIISGPSGAGEDSIIDGLAERMPIERVVTTTTRTPRPGESEGHPYYFVSEETFRTGIENDDFIEWAQQYNDNYYGVTKQELERVQQSGVVGLWKIEYKGVMKAKALAPNSTAIFITAPLDAIERRIRSRADVTEEYVQERMAYTREWLNHTDIYDATVVNADGKLDDAITQVAEIIAQKQNA